MSDSALAHATLSMVAQQEETLYGREYSQDSLYHKGEVMKLINNRLRDKDHVVCNANVIAVALLVVTSLMGIPDIWGSRTKSTLPLPSNPRNSQHGL